MLLKPNLNWESNQDILLPSVFVELEKNENFISVHFFVEEPLECFRGEIQKDGDHSWEDSCVEIFLQNPQNSLEYFNFEITCRGFLWAAKGTERNNRIPLTQSEMSQVVRIKDLANVAGNLACWGMLVKIPAELLGLKNFNGVSLKGNLYKCADLAKTPHYLSAFEIQTKKPDFHRPEFFKELF